MTVVDSNTVDGSLSRIPDKQDTNERVRRLGVHGDEDAGRGERGFALEPSRSRVRLAPGAGALTLLEPLVRCATSRSSTR